MTVFFSIFFFKDEHDLLHYQSDKVLRSGKAGRVITKSHLCGVTTPSVRPVPEWSAVGAPRKCNTCSLLPRGARWGSVHNSQEGIPLALGTHESPLGHQGGKLGWADCKTGASPLGPRLLASLSPCTQQSHTARTESQPIPFPGETSLGCCCCLSLFSSLVTELFPSDNLKEEGTGT